MKRLIIATAFFVLLILAWHLLVRTGVWSPVLLPGPAAVGEYLWEALKDGSLASSSWVTLQRLLLGYLIGCAIGLPLGILTARSKTLNDTLGHDKGDILLPQKKYSSEQIILTVENGYATKIEGGIEAQLLDEYMKTFNDPEGYAISHIGWGLQPRAHWSTLGLYSRENTIGMDARAFEGNFLFSLGPNNEAGGKRTTACHIDIPLRNCTVSLDGRAVVRDGKVLDGGVGEYE